MDLERRQSRVPRASEGRSLQGQPVRRRRWEASPHVQDLRLTRRGAIVAGGGVAARCSADPIARRHPCPGPRANYEKRLRLHFQEIRALLIRAITPKVVDAWVDAMRRRSGAHYQARKCTSFQRELSVFRVIFKYYADYYDDLEFRSPLKARHKSAGLVKKHGDSKKKDLTPDEFARFRDALAEGPEGSVLAALATVQYTRPCAFPRPLLSTGRMSSSKTRTRRRRAST